MKALKHLVNQSAYKKAGIILDKEWFNRFPSVFSQNENSQSNMNETDMNNEDEEEFVGCADTLLDLEDRSDLCHCCSKMRQ